MNPSSAGSTPSFFPVFNFGPFHSPPQTAPQQAAPPQYQVPVDGVDLGFTIRHDSDRLTLAMSGHDAPAYKADMLLLLMESMTSGCKLLPDSNKGGTEFCFQVLGDPGEERAKLKTAISAMTCALALGDVALAPLLLSHDACRRALAAGAVITGGGQTPLGSATQWDCKQLLSPEEAKDLVALAVRLIERQSSRGASPAAGLRVLLTALNRMQSFDVTRSLLSNCAEIALQHPGFFTGPTGEMFCHCLQDLLNDPKMADSATRQKIHSIREELLRMYASGRQAGGLVCFKLLLQSRLDGFDASRTDLTKTITQRAPADPNAILSEWEGDYQEAQRREHVCDRELGHYLHAYHQACLAAGNEEGANWVIRTLQGLSGSIASNTLHGCLDLQTAKTRRSPPDILAELSEQGFTVEVDMASGELSSISGYEPKKHAQLVFELAQAMWGSPIALDLIHEVLDACPADEQETQDCAYGMLIQLHLNNIHADPEFKKLDSKFETLLLDKANANDAQAQRHFIDVCRAIGQKSPEMALELLSKAGAWNPGERATLRLELAGRTEDIECLCQAIDFAMEALGQELETQLKTAGSDRALADPRQHWAHADRLLKAIHHAAMTVEYCCSDRQICKKFGKKLVGYLGEARKSDKSILGKGLMQIERHFDRARIYKQEAAVDVLWSLRGSGRILEKKLNKLLTGNLADMHETRSCSKKEKLETKIIFACTALILSLPETPTPDWQWISQTSLPQTIMEMTDHLIKSPSTNPAVAYWVMDTFIQVSSRANGCVLFDMNSKEGAQRRNFIEKGIVDIFRDSSIKWPLLVAYASCRANGERADKESSGKFVSFFDNQEEWHVPNSIRDFMADLLGSDLFPEVKTFGQESLNIATDVVSLQMRAINPQSSLNDPAISTETLDRYTKWANDLSTRYRPSKVQGHRIWTTLTGALNSPVFANGESKPEKILQRHLLLAHIFERVVR